MKNDTQAYPIKVVDCIFATDQRGYKYISKATKLFVKCDAAELVTPTLGDISQMLDGK